jgi:hypothetical protein
MIKFVLIMKVCSALTGNCLPGHNAGVHNSWYECAMAGSLNTLNAMQEIGELEVNNRKLFITFKCDPISDA